MDRQPTGRIGLRLASWYAAVFVATSLAVMVLTYVLLASSLAQRDREIVTATLREYSQRYAAGGLPALTRAVEIEQRSGRQERLFVRVVRGRSEALLLSVPPPWTEADVSRLAASGDLWEQVFSESGRARLEVAGTQLRDGTLLQVGKSSEIREALLDRFRTVLAMVGLIIIALGLAGGAVVTRSTLQPIRRLIGAVRDIIRTGKMEARVPVRHGRDAIDELSVLFNEMLERITTLIRGMEHALDNVAHDLRTPMTRLQGVAERALQSEDVEAQRKALVTCLDESRRILGMLDTLMDISEAETGTMRLERSEVGLEPLIKEVTGLYEEVAEDKRIEMIVQVDPSVTVAADPRRLRQVLANLVDNAVKYTPAGGQVRIAAQMEKDTARIDVTDTGPGISANDLPRIWARLYRGDESRTARGLGLGLSLVRAIVEAHGGTVEVASEPGRGASFTVHLPRFITPL
jgi:signal transduction histidine kinase